MGTNLPIPPPSIQADRTMHLSVANDGPMGTKLNPRY
jgi:hypothetical protein